MRGRMLLAFLTLAAAPAGAACRADSGLLTDWGLHRQWRVERDCANPWRPAQLVEVRWSDTAANQPASDNREKNAPPVQAGMSVVVTAANDVSTLQLRGMALQSGGIGDIIPVQALWNGGTLRAIVRGVGVLKLAGERTK